MSFEIQNSRFKTLNSFSDTSTPNATSKCNQKSLRTRYKKIKILNFKELLKNDTHTVSTRFFTTFIDLPHQIHTFRRVERTYRTNRSIQQRERRCSKVFVFLSILAQYDQLIPAELQTPLIILLIFKFSIRELLISSIF